MSFRSVHHILGLLENQTAWQERRQFQQLLTAWREVVSAAVAAQTRPVGIQRQVLQVATASSVWSQNLAFERVQILEKLNARLAIALVDIRFSSAQWQATSSISEAITPVAVLFQAHPCRLSEQEGATHAPDPTATPTKCSSAANDRPTAAFAGWALAMQRRSQHLPCCPVCECPTPAGELQRWSMCVHCIVKRW